MSVIKYQVRWGKNPKCPNHWKKCESFKEAHAIYELKTSEGFHVCVIEENPMEDINVHSVILCRGVIL